MPIPLYVAALLNIFLKGFVLSCHKGEREKQGKPGKPLDPGSPWDSSKPRKPLKPEKQWGPKGNKGTKEYMVAQSTETCLGVT